MKRWAVPLDQAQCARLSDDHISLGTMHKGEGGRTLLVFRDRFSALKVASTIGDAEVLDLSFTSASALATSVG